MPWTAAPVAAFRPVGVAGLTMGLVPVTDRYVELLPARSIAYTR
ncbi:hypothetical protein [Pengzhenrongella sicca]|nr:hypothetical protein [Pengzhenrongella sicca]